MTITRERPKYRYRCSKAIAKLLRPMRECANCECDIGDEDEAYCCECGSHEGCLPGDESEYIEVRRLVEAARSLKLAMLECRAAKLHRAQDEITRVLEVVYPEWPGLVAP